MRGLQILLAAAACGLALWAALAAAQVPPSQPGQPAAVSSLPRALPLRRDESPAPAAAGWLPAASLLVIVLAGVALVLVRRHRVGGSRPWKGSAAADGIARLSSQALTPQASVHAIRWGGEELLLACTPQAVTVLARRPSPQADGAGR